VLALTSIVKSRPPLLIVKLLEAGVTVTTVPLSGFARLPSGAGVRVGAGSAGVVVAESSGVAVSSPVRSPDEPVAVACVACRVNNPLRPPYMLGMTATAADTPPISTAPASAKPTLLLKN
jgi:hypothetical protein